MSDFQIDNLPKTTPGQRVKYLLAKKGYTQKEFAKKLYETEEVTEAQISNLNAKLNDKRTITPADAEKIASLFDIYPSFILFGGNENIGDALVEAIDEMNAEGDLLNAAFMSLASLSGYKIERLGVEDGKIEAVFQSLHEYLVVEDGTHKVSLSAAQLNELENILFQHAEITIKAYLKAYGKELS